MPERQNKTRLSGQSHEPQTWAREGEGGVGGQFESSWEADCSLSAREQRRALDTLVTLGQSPNP
jgi:hypothetical protein